jgi:nucleoside-diphosphate-sugar epimerase
MVLCKQLVKEGHDVTAFDRYFFGHKPDGCRIVVGDIRTVGAETLEGHDVVVDLAGLSNDAACEIDRNFTSAINFYGGRNLASWAVGSGIGRYVYASSASIYGHGEKSGLTETDETNPLTDYAKSKRCMEEELSDDFFSKMEIVILRNATVFGVSPRMRFDLAVNVMTMRAWRDKVIYVMGGGEQWRPFIHVEDVARTIIWALTARKEVVAGQTFNVGSADNQVTVGHLATMVANYFPDAKIHRIPDETDQRSYHLSFDKFFKASDLRKFKTIDYGITEIMRALNNGSIDPNDPRTITLNWYKSMLEWKDRLDTLSKDGPIL